MSDLNPRRATSGISRYAVSSLLCGLLTWAGGCNFASSADDSEADCPVGSRGCPCTSGSGCDPNLSCIDSVCVRVSSGTGGDTGDAGSSSSGASGQSSGSGGSTGGGSGETGTGGSSEGGSSGQPGAGGSAGQSGAGGSSDGSSGQASGGTSGSGMVDVCAQNGGELLARGFCFKSCTFSTGALGNDLFSDCADLRMVCSSLGDYCVPPTWREECGSDSDCQPGGRCTTERYVDGSVAQRVCRIDCSTDPNCGTLGCMQECASGLVSPTGVCDYTGFICCAEYPNACEG